MLLCTLELPASSRYWKRADVQDWLKRIQLLGSFCQVLKIVWELVLKLRPPCMCMLYTVQLFHEFSVPDYKEKNTLCRRRLNRVPFDLDVR